MNRLISFLALLTLACATTGAEPRPCVLDLRNDDFVRGRLADVSDGVMTWHSDHFAKPLRFPLTAVAGMKFAPSVDRPQPEGDFLIEFNNRDAIFGNVLAIQEDEIKVESPHLGICSFRTKSVNRITRRGPAMEVYPVPSRLEDWHASKEDEWRSEGSSFVTDKPLASIYADLQLPDRAMIELEFAWAKTKASQDPPSFSIYFGTDGSVDSRKQAFSIDAWDTFTVVQRQVEDDADLAALPTAREKGSMHAYVYIDQQAGQLLLYDVSGKLLADLEVPNPNAQGPGLMFCNRRGEFKLNYVYVRGWSGAKPTEVQEDVVTVVTSGGHHRGRSVTVQDGILSIDPGSDRKVEDDARTIDEKKLREYVDVQAEKAEEVAELRVALDRIRQIDFPIRRVASLHEIVAGFVDGSRISGKLTAADETHLSIQSQTSPQILKLPLDALRGFAMHHAEAKSTSPQTAPTGFRIGRVELMDTRLHGWLVETDELPVEGASCLTWQPTMAENASPIVDTAYGRLVYRDPPKPAAPAKVNNANQRGFLVLGGMRQRAATPSKRKTATTKSSRAVHLRSGDVLPGLVTRIDEAGVHIDSAATETKLLRHDQVKAAQLIDNAPTPLLAKAKRERLLTLPRMQRNAPPTHLLFSTHGDVLRGNLISADKDNLLLEVRLNPYPIPRSRVATVVWLHEDELEGSEPAPGRERIRPKPDHQLMVQVVENSGTRFSFLAESFENQTIYGSSEVLQAMHAKLGEIDQLLLGGFIKSNAKTLKFGRWHLSPAPDPKYVTATNDSSGNESTDPGTESILVGKPAPPLKLKMLDETTDFRLSDHRGHCVVLDFWATWCGPCLQVMPIVEQVVAEFADQDVKLFAVNLEERPTQIKATLERRKLAVDVVLDRDGVAAARYEANAIPQTVIIAPDGTVARVFVGSSRTFENNLRAALKELTE